MSEPMTVLTDYLLALVAAGLAARLIQAARAGGERSVLLWGVALGATAVAATAGGTYHGFAPGPEGGWLPVWKMTVYAVGVAAASMLAGTLIAAISGALRRVLLGAVALKLCLYAAWMTVHNDFRWVIYDYAPSMFAVLLLAVAVRRTVRGAGWIAAGVIVSFVGAAVQRSGFDLVPHYFNHNDLYHVIQIGAIYLFYRGARMLTDHA